MRAKETNLVVVENHKREDSSRGCIWWYLAESEAEIESDIQSEIFAAGQIIYRQFREISDRIEACLLPACSWCRELCSHLVKIKKSEGKRQRQRQRQREEKRDNAWWRLMGANQNTQRYMWTLQQAAAQGEGEANLGKREANQIEPNSIGCLTK